MTATRPHIAILGAGPTGLEAALAAADHGYPFTLYEAAPAVAGYLRSWGHVRLFTPWRLNVSPRMRRHLEAAGHQPPTGDACPTGNELADAAFDPLARSDAIVSNLQTGVRVLEIGRDRLLKHEEIGTGRRSGVPFRLLLVGSDGKETVARADVVLDCTGTYGTPNALGDGGIAAPGERPLAEAIVRRIPDVLSDPGSWADRVVLVVGAGHSAHTAVSDLALLAESRPQTRVLWALRSETPRWEADPADPLPSRAALIARAKALASGESAAVRAIHGVVVDGIAFEDGRYHVGLRRHDGSLQPVVADAVLSLTGYVGDHMLYRQLQVHECYATSGPMKLASALLGAGSADCLAQESHGADTLSHPEPDFFILGSKSYGRNNAFLMRVGWQQVDEVYGLLAARTDSQLGA